MPRRREEISKNSDDWVITLAVGLIMATVTILVSSASDVYKAFGSLALLFVGYAVYNERDKRRSKKN